MNLAGPGRPASNGVITLTVMSAWGEPLKSQNISTASTSGGPWIEFLLTTQHADGSWLVPTRAFPVQPYFESGFPFDRHQWISAAGTGWAANAIAVTLADTQ